MKRKRSDLTLWNVCHVHKHGTMWRWWKLIRRKNFCDRDDSQSEYIDDLDMIKSLSGVSKAPRYQKEEKFLTTFSVGLKPTPHQRRVLNLMLKVTNYTYNWCLYLVNEMGMKANQFELQKIVCKTNAKDVDPVYRLPQDDWFFENKMSGIKTTACKSFCVSHKAAIKKKSALKKKTRRQRLCCGRFYRYSETRCKVSLRQCRGPRSTQIVIMKGSLGGPMRISKRVDRIPPFEHDFKIVKRPNGKFILQIPCDPSYTRRNVSNDQVEKRICGIDPGGRTFATVFDPIAKIAFQVGTEENKKFDLRPIHDKIDETHWHLSNAQKRNKTRVAEERQRQLKKLHLKLKTFVNHIHLSSHLVKHYELVSLGKISISSIVKKEVGKRLIPRRAKRDLLCWQHYKFRERLLHRSVGTDCEIIVQNEAYTSKTCGQCGMRNNNLGASETFICNSCQYETHRDINGARNILLKSLKMFPFARKL